MVDGGLLTRVADPHDRRTVRIGATEKGAALSHLVNFHDDITATLTKGFTTAEIDTFFALLARIENNARDIPDSLA